MPDEAAASASICLIEFGGITPILRVANLEASLDYLHPGALIRHPPSSYPWGSRELQVTDPDGHVLRFGGDVIPGEPVGDWLDGDGVR